MNSTQTILHSAQEQCKKQGSRLTKKRKLILNALIEADRALSAYEVIDFCKDNLGESIQAMSVYRILDFLQKENLVHRLNLANKYIACSHIKCMHSHATPQFLICNQCESVKEINVSQSTIETLYHDVEQEGFRLSSPQFEMRGICNNCL